MRQDPRYRYTLNRHVGDNRRTLLWVMLNPSTADEEQDDPTIRRVKSFTAAAGYGRLTVVNLFAKRCTDPKLLFDGEDPTGPLNGLTLLNNISSAEAVVAAWGGFWAGLPLERRPPRPGIESMARRYKKPLLCLGLTKDGHPRHPLYVPSSAQLVPFGSS